MESDPSNYEEAIVDSDSGYWVKAMKTEMESMDSNQVWELVEPPANVKPIGCKWVFKRKRGSDGKVETFKARLMAKGFTQKEGIDYEETFSPMAMLKFIRILLSITAFLNGNLEEDIYIQQPEGFIAGRKDSFVCKLQKSIYELK